jgi:hypothetical protein
LLIPLGSHMRRRSLGDADPTTATTEEYLSTEHRRARPAPPAACTQACLSFFGSLSLGSLSFRESLSFSRLVAAFRFVCRLLSALSFFLSGASFSSSEPCPCFDPLTLRHVPRASVDARPRAGLRPRRFVLRWPALVTGAVTYRVPILVDTRYALTKNRACSSVRVTQRWDEASAPRPRVCHRTGRDMSAGSKRPDGVHRSKHKCDSRCRSVHVRRKAGSGARVAPVRVGKPRGSTVST